MGRPLSGVPHVGRRTETRKDVIKYIYGGRLCVILRPKKLKYLPAN